MNAAVTVPPETTKSPAITEVVTHARWQPSSDEMQVYIGREVELCVQAIERGTATAQSHTLYSQRTWDTALAKFGGKLPVIEPHIAASIEAMRAAAQAASTTMRSGFARNNNFAPRRP